MSLALLTDGAETIGREPRDRWLTRFWSRVDKAEGCWLWRGARLLNGYGQTLLNKRHQYVHRVSYALAKGPIPHGLHLDHLCRTKLCVNPAHLEAVTPRVNIIRGVGFSAVNAAKDRCVHGHPFDEANTYVQPSTGYRHCRTCMRAYDDARRDRHNAQKRASRARKRELQRRTTEAA